jgi:hypothetical protein
MPRIVFDAVTVSTAKFYFFDTLLQGEFHVPAGEKHTGWIEYYC